MTYKAEVSMGMCGDGEPGQRSAPGTAQRRARLLPLRFLLPPTLLHLHISSISPSLCPYMEQQQKGMQESLL